MSEKRVLRITAPSILKALRIMGIETGAQYMALDAQTLVRMMKGKGFTQHQRRYISRVGPRTARRGDVVIELGEPSDGSLVPNFAPTAVTMRDYFAARAMQGQFAALWDVNSDAGQCVLNDDQAQAVAKSAYKMADAMLRVRLNRT